MRKPSKTWRQHLSSFVSISIAISGFQLISISAAPVASALTWTDIAVPGGGWHTKDWNQIRTSTDGSVIGVVSAGSAFSNTGDFYLSRDSGSTWTNTSGRANWGLRTLAVSGDGTRAIAAHDESLFRSTFSGSSWSTTTLTWTSATNHREGQANSRCSWIGPNFNSLATTPDGTKWIAGVRDEVCVYTSNDSGATWYGKAVGSTNLGSAISSDGSIKITANSDGKLYRYSGSTWSAIASTNSSLPSSAGWSNVVCNSTCTKMAAIQSATGKIYITADSGATWINGDSTSRTYTDLSMSSDGTSIAATSGTDVYISQNSGLNWTAQALTGNKTWASVTISGDGKKIYAAASDGTIRKSAFLAAQSALSISSTTGVFGTNLTLSTSGGSGSGSVTYSYAAGTTTCSLVGGVLTANGAGTCLITATKAADDIYGLISSSQTTVTFSRGSQTAALVISSVTGTFGTSLSLTTTGGNGSGSNTFVVDSGPCTVSGSTLNSSGVGTCMVTATKAADTNYLVASSTSTSIAIARQAPTFTWSGISKAYGDSFTITAPSPSTPGSFIYTSANASVVTLDGEIANVVGVGTSLITATFTPTDTTNFKAGETTTMTVTSAKAAITVTPTAGQSKIYGANNPTLSYSITSGSLIGSDTLSGALAYTGTNVGNYSITIGTLANSSYEITLASVNFGITKATQTAVSLSSISAAYNPSNKTVSLTGSGGGSTGGYTYDLDPSNTTIGCSVNGSILTYTTAGTCVIAVTHEGDTNHLARTDAVSFTIGLASQTITFRSLSAKSYSSDTFTVSATSSASLTVVFTSASQSVCTTSGVSGSTITLLNVGTCVINANQIGDSNVGAASQVSQNFTVNPRAVTVTADAKTKAYGASDPTLTYTITTGSLVLGDALTGALTRATGTDVGTYQIQQGALTTANNPKYAITFVSADLAITRATPTLVLTYPNSNVAILRPAATDTPTVTTSSSSGSLTFATTAAGSICTVNSASGVISLFGAGSCPVAMTTAQTANFLQYTETTTVTVALLSTSLTGINQSNLVSMGQPFYAHASIDQSYSFSSGSNGASVAIPAGALDASVPISIHLLADSTDQRALITSDGTSVLSVVVSWVASDGSVPSTNTGKAISVTLTNPAIKSGAKVYSIIGNQSTLLGTATANGSITTLITEDPVLLVINPVVTTPAPSSNVGGSGGGGGYVMATVVDNSAAIEAANLKLAADKAAAELKAAQEKAAAAEAEAAAVKAAKDLADAQAQAAAELKASQDKAAEELRIAEELRLAQLKAEADLKLAAEKKALADFATAARNAKAAVTLYSVSPSLKLSSYDSTYLAKYVKSLKNGASVTCIGYTYGKSPASKASQTLAKRQASAVCAQMKKTNKTLKASIVIYPATKAPKAATGAKWVGVSYRIDGYYTGKTS
ncbi:beta strand repeat-containing protein [Candidatus Planktophila dulcis]|uniref:beta strand repeat-containing protein n=1 Tax=Candidatus Planktophila dulcis TaxID=1884914 RepID=UPI003BEED96F